MIFIKLFLTFLEIGALSFGGGYGMIALMRELTLANGWLTEAELLDIAPEKVACVGDSWNDLPMLRAAGRAFAPADALGEIRAEPGVVTVGDCPVCIRDVVELLRKG